MLVNPDQPVSKVYEGLENIKVSDEDHFSTMNVLTTQASEKISLKVTERDDLYLLQRLLLGFRKSQSASEWG